MAKVVNFLMILKFRNFKFFLFCFVFYYLFLLTLYGEMNVMYVDKALHVVHSLIEVKTYMYFVSCSAFIVDISEIELGVF